MITGTTPGPDAFVPLLRKCRNSRRRQECLRHLWHSHSWLCSEDHGSPQCSNVETSVTGWKPVPRNRRGPRRSRRIVVRSAQGKGKPVYRARDTTQPPMTIRAPPSRVMGAGLWPKPSQEINWATTKKKGDVHTQEPPEIPRRGVDGVAVKSQDQPAEQEEHRRTRVGRGAHSHPHQSVTARFQARGAQQNHHGQAVSQRKGLLSRAKESRNRLGNMSSSGSRERPPE